MEIQQVPMQGHTVPAGVSGNDQPIVPNFAIPSTVQAAAPAPSVSKEDIADIVNKALQSAQTPVANTTHNTNSANNGNSVAGFDTNNIDDPIIRSVVSTLKSVSGGIDLDKAIGAAIDSGDVTQIDYAYIAQHGGAQASQITELARSTVTAIAAVTSSVVKEVHTMVGGADKWNMQMAVFKQSAPKELQIAVDSLSRTPKREAVIAAAQIVSNFANGSGRLASVGTSPLTVMAGASPAQALSKEEFQAELIKLKPESKTYLQDMASLKERRKLGMMVNH